MQAAQPILRDDFQSWRVTGNGSVETARGVLTFRYNADQHSPSSISRSLAGLPMAEWQSLRFEIRTDIARPVAIVIGEHPALVWSKGTDWQQIVLARANFGAISNISNIEIIDDSQIVGGAPVYTAPQPGAHTIALRALEISRDPLPETPASMWISPGGVSLDQRANSLTAVFDGMPAQLLGTRFMSIIRFEDNVPPNATHVSMDIASSRRAEYLIAIQETQGARYNAHLTVQAGPLSHRNVALAAFVRDESGPIDPDNKLSPLNIRTITLMDITGNSAPNTLTLRNFQWLAR